MVDVHALLAAERAELVALLRGLTDEQWDTPSLCAGWRVREVAGHLLHDTIPIRTYAGIVARERFGVDRVNDTLAAKAAAMPTAAIIDKLVEAPKHFSRRAPKVILADMIVHQQDIRRPLGLPRTIAADRLRMALDHPDPFAFPKRRTRGLRFTATDLDWSNGDGPEVRGPGEALALAIVGRPVVLDELEGDGVGILRRRIA
ncbi:MAG TPA: maleylpyruvate isomerase family mycothiol-dependent enzyme [Nocardioides sp.]|nr:maleylpyruvate isomerase family mycothiol-dependent enzyme [Nocardioides sp.]